MARRIIDNKKINWNDLENSKLNYQMIFEEKVETLEKEETEEEGFDIVEVLSRKEREWKKKLEEACKEAYAHGIEEGRKRGADEARAEIDSKLATLENAFAKAHEEWKEKQNYLEPALLDMVFEITEAILEIPVENPAIRTKLEEEIAPLLHKIDDSSKSVLWVSESDFSYIEKLVNEYTPENPVTIRVSKECNPGEFELETSRETIVRSYEKMLGDFKDSLALPSWK